VVATPENSDTNNRYHVIYVVAGIYNEYVSIPKSKHNLMLIGNGINSTVLAGDCNVVDGWTTFQSATFGKPCSKLTLHIMSYFLLMHAH